jgi:IrrE N-terminal-like domain
VRNMSGSALILRRRLRDAGLSDPALNAAWPTWWSEAAEASPSAAAELRFSLARKLGLDPRSLMDDESAPRFAWRDQARFKHLSNEDEQELSAITSFGTAIANVLVSATPSTAALLPDATTLRGMLLRSRPFIGLADLLSVSWSVAIPVIHLRVFPRDRKRMAAMAVSTGNRNAILLGKDSEYPAHVAFYLAHELAHIALGHLAEGNVLVDMDSNLETPRDDKEEMEADRFALELLTGQPQPTVLPFASRYTARQLAEDALRAAFSYRIEPGTLALCFGYSSGDWATANAAMRFIYTEPKPVWNEVNRVARSELVEDLVTDDNTPYLSAVLGGEAFG